ncbi:MAG TPA: hypothetical protein VIY86_01000 [Pirellulaceae bacterium]
MTRNAHGRRCLFGFAAARLGMWCLAGVVAASVHPLWAFSIVDNSTGPMMDMNLWCKSVLDPHPVTYLAAGGASAMGQRATLLADFPGIAPGQVVLGAAAPGTLTIDQYYAWVSGDAGGAGLLARYDDGDGVSDWVLPGGPNPSYRWVQEINTNKPLGGAGSPYIDPRPGDDVKQGAAAELPYYWTDKEAINKHTNGPVANPYDLRFSDEPSRPCNMMVDWEADLFIVSENNFTYPTLDPTHVITIHDGIRWGFELTPKLLKLSIQQIIDTIRSVTPIPTLWTTGIAETQQFGTATLATLHAGNVTTSGIQMVSDTASATLNMTNGLLKDYSFHVETITSSLHSLDVFVTDLDDFNSSLSGPGEMEFDLSIPIVITSGNSELSMTLSLERDLLVVVNESLASLNRNDPASLLYLGPFSTFDPSASNLQVIGFRDLHFNVVPEPLGFAIGTILLLIVRSRSTWRR